MDGPPSVPVVQPALRNGLKRSWLQRLNQRVWKIEDPLLMKSVEELALTWEDEGHSPEPLQQLHLQLLKQRKATLGPCHPDTRRSLRQFAQACLAVGNADGAHLVLGVASAVCDFTLGTRHPESRAVLGELAGAVLARGKPGLARGYYRQLLERTLSVVEWDDDEAFLPKFFLHALAGNAELHIVQGREGARVQIMGFDPGMSLGSSGNTAAAVAAREAGIGNPEQETKGEDGRGKQSQNRHLVLHLENTDIVFDRYTVARTFRAR